MIRKLLFGIAALVLVAVLFVVYHMMQPPPDDLDLRTERLSEHGIYRVTFRPQSGEPKQGPIQAWIVTVVDKHNKPVTGAVVSVDGGMPQHGHGLPTAPAMKNEISPGKYLIDGVKFSMSGWWEFRLKIMANAGDDMVRFNVVLE